MFRAKAIAVLVVAGFATPAVADDVTPKAPVDTHAIQAFTAQLAWRAIQVEKRRMLADQGFIVTSDLDRTNSGHWVGTALKDGVPVRIALKMPPREKMEPLIN